ncbi:hypothetical protein BgiBS90_026570 [Biomphalaria glabrata]|nr:hypothetical protein BgiBS90_026570 [Biomphalaria glabrata]
MLFQSLMCFFFLPFSLVSPTCCGISLGLNQGRNRSKNISPSSVRQGRIPAPSSLCHYQSFPDANIFVAFGSFNPRNDVFVTFI